MAKPRPKTTKALGKKQPVKTKDPTYEVEFLPIEQRLRVKERKEAAAEKERRLLAARRLRKDRRDAKDRRQKPDAEKPQKWVAQTEHGKIVVEFIPSEQRLLPRRDKTGSRDRRHKPDRRKH
jgi:hypothetical protein